MTTPTPPADLTADLAEEMGLHRLDFPRDRQWHCTGCDWTVPDDTAFPEIENAYKAHAAHLAAVLAARVGEWNAEQVGEVGALAARYAVEANEAKTERDALAARVQALADRADSESHMNGDSYGAVVGTDDLRALLSDADTTALDERVREARAGAWDEGQAATIEDHGTTCHQTYTVRDNPYRDRALAERSS